VAHLLTLQIIQIMFSVASIVILLTRYYIQSLLVYFCSKSGSSLTPSTRQLTPFFP
jgi:hypothetical protein